MVVEVTGGCYVATFCLRQQPNAEMALLGIDKRRRRGCS